MIDEAGYEGFKSRLANYAGPTVDRNRVQTMLAEQGYDAPDWWVGCVDMSGTFHLQHIGYCVRGSTPVTGEVNASLADCLIRFLHTGDGSVLAPIYEAYHEDVLVYLEKNAARKGADPQPRVRKKQR